MTGLPIDRLELAGQTLADHLTEWAESQVHYSERGNLTRCYACRRPNNAHHEHADECAVPRVERMLRRWRDAVVGMED